MVKKTTTFALFCCIATSAIAIEPALRHPTVVPSARGAYYAKLLPAPESSGYEGRTEIYEIGFEADDKLFTSAWYSPVVYLAKVCGGLSVVRIGTELYGIEANNEDMAIEVYKNNKLLRSYSTLQIAKKPDRVRKNANGYEVFQEHRFEPSFTLRFIDQQCPQVEIFTLETVDKRELSVDLHTGLLYEWVNGKRRVFR